MVAAAAAPSGGRRNHPQSSKSDLSRGKARLVEVMQDINFGRLERLQIRDGEPVLDSESEIVREIKFGGENGPRREREVDDFLLKSQVIELLAFISQLRVGVIEVLEIKHGLPFRILVREAAA